MKYSIFYSLQAPEQFNVSPQQVYAEALDQIQRADELGIHQVWLTEHHFMDDGYCPSPMIAAAAIAGRTRNIRIGQGVVLLPFYGHPLRLAEDTAVLDLASGGRFELGVGRGYRENEFAGFGVNIKKRKGMTDEGLEILKLAWTGERFSFSGKYYQVDNARLSPLPVQRPPPVWLGAVSAKARREIAEAGHPLLISLLTTVEETKQEFSDHTNALTAIGRNSADYPRALIREFYVAEDNETAWREVQPHFAHIYRNVYCPPYLPFYDENPDGSKRLVTDPNDEYLESERFRKDRHIIGDPEFCANELRRYRDDAGIDNVILRMQFPGQPNAQVMNSLELLVKEVIPRV
ncbi:MAG: alkanesulfonate monooxygenase SsuD [Gammaproteobacteria bacterium]|jgi:alkanesulfonate monooxygenase SsuD/methylene tetrahydromethanopterin reductase-like flavin-dependent oxidoreductase (luciferase family)